MKLNKEIIDEINKRTNCSVSENEDNYTIYVDNACDEDFTLEINKGEDEVEEIISQCDNFDSEEHFRLWFGANNGEPSNPRTLLDNCDEIGENLNTLALLLRDIQSRGKVTLPF